MGSGSNCLPNQKTHRERLRQAPAEVRGVKGIIWAADLTSLIERVAEVASSGFPGLSTFWGVTPASWYALSSLRDVGDVATGAGRVSSTAPQVCCVEGVTAGTYGNDPKPNSAQTDILLGHLEALSNPQNPWLRCFDYYVAMACKAAGHTS